MYSGVRVPLGMSSITVIWTLKFTFNLKRRVNGKVQVTVVLP